MSEEKIIGSGLDDCVLLPENEQKRGLLTEVRSEAEGDADVCSLACLLERLARIKT